MGTEQSANVCDPVTHELLCVAVSKKVQHPQQTYTIVPALLVFSFFFFLLLYIQLHFLLEHTTVWASLLMLNYLYQCLLVFRSPIQSSQSCIYFKSFAPLLQYASLRPSFQLKWSFMYVWVKGYALYQVDLTCSCVIGIQSIRTQLDTFCRVIKSRCPYWFGGIPLDLW